jgi:hypothetical protein
MLCLLKMKSAAVTHLVEGLGLETLLTSKVEKSPTRLVGMWRPTSFVIEVIFVFESVNMKQNIIICIQLQAMRT